MLAVAAPELERRRSLAELSDEEAGQLVTVYAKAVVAGEIVAGDLIRKAAQRHLDDLKTGELRGLRFDEREAGFHIRFFPVMFRHYKGEWGPIPGVRREGMPVELALWECFFVGSLFGWRRRNPNADSPRPWLRRFRRFFLEVAKKNGKALALDTPIPTPTGWSTMGELRAGDEVLDEAGRPCRVLGVTEIQRDRPCYRVTFTDHTSIVADAEHEWLTERLEAHGDYTRAVRTTREIAESLLRPGDGARRHRIPVAQPLALPDADLPINPYVLGVWLGDGDTTSAMLTTADEQILDEIAALGVAVGGATGRPGLSQRHLLGSRGRSQAGRAASLQADLRRLGVLGNKHVPSVYLRGSVDQRLALLQGLMDTDGHVTPRGQCEFTTTRRALRDGFLELARSLGLKARAREGVATLYGRAIGPKWRITFHGRRELPPVRLARKLLRVRAAPDRQQRSASRHIAMVEPVSSVPVRCIEVDSPSHLYLAGEAMVPTHNSLIAAGIGCILTFFDDEPGAEGYSLATKREQARLVFSDQATLIEKSPALSRRIRTAAKSLFVLETKQKFMPLSSEEGGEDGINPHVALVDELHRITSRGLVDLITESFGAREQPVLGMITTAGIVGESIWGEEHEYAEKVVNGVIDDDSLLALIYTVDNGDDPLRDESCWPKANPNLGVSVNVDDLRRAVQEAREKPGKAPAVLRLRFNVRTQAATRSIDIDRWDKDGKPFAAPSGAVSVLGLDLGWTRDLSSATLLTAVGDGTFDLRLKVWCPEAAVRIAVEQHRLPYRQWVDEGWITETEGNVRDDDQVVADIVALRDVDGWDIQQVRYDRAMSTNIVRRLEAEGFICEPQGQQIGAIAGAFKELERLYLSDLLRTDGNPVLRWMASNVESKEDDNGNARPVKPNRNSPLRIDGVSATIDAIAAHLDLELEEGFTSIWESRTDEEASLLL